MPCKCNGNLEYNIIQGLHISNDIKCKLDISIKELQDEANDII